MVHDHDTSQSLVALAQIGRHIGPMHWILSKIPVIRIGRFICLIAPYFLLAFCLVFTVGTRTLAPEERLATIIQLFYKAVREGKYEIAQQYLSRWQPKFKDPAKVWADIADTLTKNGTLQTVEVSGDTKISVWGVEEKTRMGSVVTRFADGSSQRLRIVLAKEGDQWKIFWIGKIREEEAFQDYVVSIFSTNTFIGDRHTYYEILQGSHRVYMSDLTIGSHSFSLSHQGHYDQKGNYTEKIVVPMGKDITGEGSPNLVVFEWQPSGTHCCFVYHIFEIGREFRKIAELMGGDRYVDFVDLDGDSKLEVVLSDWSFAYFLTYFADYHPPEVILHYQDGAYRIAVDLMHKPAPSRKELERLAQQAREDDASWEGDYIPGPRSVPKSLYAPMLELISTGHQALAWQFFDLAWPPEIKGKNDFLRKFRTRLEGSPFWPLDGKLRIPFRNRATYVDEMLREQQRKLRKRWERTYQ